MKREHEFKKNLAMAMIIGAVLAMGGCDKQTSSGETVGQRVDKAIDKTNETAERAGTKIGETAKSAEDAVKATTEGAKAKAEQVGGIIDDSAITASVKTGLVKDPGLSALRIDVNTVKGEVTLKGEVDSAAARERAERIASAVTGVVKVNNSLSIKG